MSAPATTSEPPKPDAGTGVLDRAINGAMIASGGLIVLLALVVTGSVIMRQVFGIPSILVFEASENSLLFITFLAVAFVARQDGHVRMEILGEFGPRWLLRVTDVLADAIGLLVGLVLTYAAGLTTYESWQRGTSTVGIIDVPAWVVLIVIPVGAVLLSLHQARAVFRRLTSDA